MRVAVTGATGFVGGAVCRHLAGAGWEVVPYGRRTDLDPAHTAGVPVLRWDIGAGPLPEPPAVDAVVHSAAFVADVGSEVEARRINVTGTRHVADTFPAARFVHISSASVYDPHLAQVMAAEDEAPDPDTTRWSNAYGRTKSEAERLLRRVRPDAVVLRPHGVYGPGDTTLLPRMREAGKRGVLPIPGDGRQRHSLTHIDNFTAAIELACDPAAPAGTYNVTDAEPVLLAGILAEAARKPDGRPARIRPVPEPVLLGVAWAAETAAALKGRLTGHPGPPLISRYAVEHLARERTFDISAARAKLGYQPAPTSLAGLEDW